MDPEKQFVVLIEDLAETSDGDNCRRIDNHVVVSAHTTAEAVVTNEPG
jgi:hypothetical protein